MMVPIKDIYGSKKIDTTKTVTLAVQSPNYSRNK